MKKRIASIFLVFGMFIVSVGIQTTDANAEASDAAVKFLKGKWYSASSGEGGPNWYVVFTKKYVKRYSYNTKKGKYVFYTKHEIKSTKKISSGYRIKVKAGKIHYTYQSAEGDKNALEFYGTWKLSEFGNTYSGSSSVFREKSGMAV